MEYIARLSPAQCLEHVARSHHLWGRGETQEGRATKLLKRMETYGPDGLFLSGLVEGGKLVASLKRYHFNLSVAGQIGRCVGIGAVYTAESHRKRGLATTLLRKVLDESLVQYHCSHALLYSDIDPRYYERFGFHQCPAFSWEVAVDALGATHPFEARAARPEDRKILMAWLHADTASHKIHMEHTADTWQLLHDVNGVEQDLVLTEGGSMGVGYLSINHNRKECYLWINGFHVPAAHVHRLWATVRTLAQAAGLKTVKGWKTTPQSVPHGAAIVPRKKAIPMLATLRGLAPPAPVLQDAVLLSRDHY